MLSAIFRFEMERRLRAISTYVYFLLFGALGFLMMVAAGGGLPGATFNFGGEKVFVNSPYALTIQISILGAFGLLVTAAVAGRAGYQDFDYQSEPFFFTAPIRKIDYLGGRFLAAVTTLTAIYSSMGLGMYAATWVTTLDHAKVGPNHLLAYVMPYLTSVIPNALLMGAIFFSLAALTRRIYPVYVGSVVLLTGYLISGTLTENLDTRWVAALADPFGMNAVDRVTQYWTIAEKNGRLLGLEGLLLWNRVLWLGVAAAVAAFTWWKFRMQHSTARGGRRKARPAAESARGLRARPSLGPLARLAWLDFVETVKNVYFLVILLCGMLFLVLAARTTESIYGTPTYPVTHDMMMIAGGTFYLFVLILITFYAGELVWRERDARIHEITDSLPLGEWTRPLSKLLALLMVPVLLQAILMATCMAIQLSRGYTRLEPLLYAKQLLGIDVLDYWLLVALAIAVQSLVNNKYLGHFVMVLYYMARAFMGLFGLEHPLYRYPWRPDYTYSDMNGFGGRLGPVFWFDAYWAALAVLLALGARLFWPIGVESGWRWRWRLARRRFGRPERAVALAAGAAFVGLGGFIFYNTNILHRFRTSTGKETLAARYEKGYRWMAEAPQPRIVAVSLNVDLYPRTGGVRVRGRYEIANKTGSPIDRFLVDVPERWKFRRFAFTPAARLVSEDRALYGRLYQMERPMPPGTAGTLEFDMEAIPRGFSADGLETYAEPNGTFLNDVTFPQFGYGADVELSSDRVRRKYGLAPKPRAADIHDRKARRNNYISSDADWVTYDAVISTDAGQTAVAPGELVREWTEGERRYFEYRTRARTIHFWSVLSARYRVLRDKWNDVDLAIYYQPGHEYNLARMMKGMKDALTYCTANFSPYQNKTLRIVEFPRYATFAQAFLATIPFSEGVGFIARVDPSNENDIDYPYYVTAHEVGHQWWAHQAIGANVQGATVMSESLAQYTALMVMKREFGAEHMRRFLKYEMDRYLNGRSDEAKKEMPLGRNEVQPYIYYQKGSVVFYALQDYIGELNLNRALRTYLESVAYQEPPYTTALELEARLREATPPQYSHLIDDLFDSITLYENSAVEAKYREVSKGRYEVKLKVKARKVKADDSGVEREVPLADWIDIGVFDAKKKPLYLAKHMIDKPEMEFTLTVDGVPDRAGIDPWNKLVDREPDDNTTRVTKQGM
ncbi:MAG TPA: M1 family aminopeptidase [Bryobacteraceae bacterium]|nr:M1 family aminopeptidase [Bryobacteraceae bacterium]